MARSSRSTNSSRFGSPVSASDSLASVMSVSDPASRLYDATTADRIAIGLTALIVAALVAIVIAAIVRGIVRLAFGLLMRHLEPDDLM